MNNILISVIIFPLLIFSCDFNNKESELTENDQNIINETYDMKLTYHRQERSKDSNGNETVIQLTDNTLTYKEKQWGFKAKEGEINKQIKISDERASKIFEFIHKNLPQKSYKKEIITKNKRAFTTIRYILDINKDSSYSINISSNDMQTKNKYYNNLEDLFSNLKLEFVLQEKD